MELVIIIFCCILFVSFITGLIITLCNLLRKEKPHETVTETKIIPKPVVKSQPIEVLSFDYTTVYEGPLVSDEII